MDVSRIRRVLTFSALALSLTFAAPSGFADDHNSAPSGSRSVSPSHEASEHEDGERGIRIDKEFEASHPLEWIAVGLAIAVAMGLAYTAGRRRRDKGE